MREGRQRVKLYEGQLPSRACWNPILFDLRYPDQDSPLPVVLFIHGFKGYKDWGPFPLVSEMITQAGFACLTPSLSFSGVTPNQKEKITDPEAFGENTLSAELDDLHDLLAWLRSDQNPIRSRLDLEKIFLVGHSRGGTLAILTASEDAGIKKIVCWTAISNIAQLWTWYQRLFWKLHGVTWEYDQWYDRWLPIYYTFARDYYFNFNRLHVESAVRKLTIPFLMIHPEDDEVLPFKMSLDIKDWYPPLRLAPLPEGGHLFGMKHPHQEPVLPPLVEQALDQSLVFLRMQ